MNRVGESVGPGLASLGPGFKSYLHPSPVCLSFPDLTFQKSMTLLLSLELLEPGVEKDTVKSVNRWEAVPQPPEPWSLPSSQQAMRTQSPMWEEMDGGQEQESPGPS